MESTVSAARAAVAGHLRRVASPGTPLEDIRLALSEAVTNVVMHAYIGRQRPGEVRVHVACTPDQVLVAVEDDGRGLVPRTDSPGGGMGLPLIAALADRVDRLSTPAGGTHLGMWFSRDAAAAAPA